MSNLDSLFERNRAWAERRSIDDPDYFTNMARGQNPEYLWIGCADSRVPAERLCGLRPGEIFVHRNVANQVIHTDLNCLSVLQYAVEVLKVKHVLVVGHYCCSGVEAALVNAQLGLINNWLLHIRDIYRRYQKQLDLIPNHEDKVNRLSELNVIEQTYNMANSTVMQAAWQRGQEITVHGVIYGMEEGLLLNTGFSVNSSDKIDQQYDKAVAKVLDSSTL